MIFPKLDTPNVLVDLDVVENNIDRYQSWCDKRGLKLRPHIKTHKMPAIALMQLKAGACGITCQKLSEALAMVKGTNVSDVLLTYNIIGDKKLKSLRQLAELTKLSVTADSNEIIRGLSRALDGSGIQLEVLVECDTGANRCGIMRADQALILAKLICELSNLKFKGLMTFPPVGKEEQVQSWLETAKSTIESAGIPVPEVSVGGSVGMWNSDKIPIATEWRTGTYVYNDRKLLTLGICKAEDCAGTVLSTVISTPEPNRVIIDAGSKVLTSDLLGLTGHGMVLGHPEVEIDSLSEEHGRLVADSPISLSVGDRVRIVPNHICVVMNMLAKVCLVRGEEFVSYQEIPARGQVW